MAQITQNTSNPAATPDLPNAGSVVAARYAVDPSHTHVGFSVRHLMITNVRGEFGKVTGELTYDPQRPEATRLRASVDVASINTREEKRDAHLRSADFFDVERFPTLEFASTAARRTEDGLELVGDLTIHGVTRPVTFQVEDIAREQADPWGNLRIGALARAKLRRSDFGMVWNAALEAGGVLVGDDVKIEIEAELIKQA